MRLAPFGVTLILTLVTKWLLTGDQLVTIMLQSNGGDQFSTGALALKYRFCLCQRYAIGGIRDQET